MILLICGYKIRRYLHIEQAKTNLKKEPNYNLLIINF